MFSQTNDISRRNDFKILHENAFERFHLASSSLRLMEKILMDRQKMECEAADLLDKFCKKWNKILRKHIDLEYGSLRHAWGEVINECNETAKTHNKVQTEIGRDRGPLDVLRACMSPSYNERIREVIRHFRDVKTMYTQLVNHIHRTKRIYYRHCKKFNRLKAEFHRKRYRNPKCPKFQVLKLRLEKQEQEVMRTRLIYRKKVLREKEKRPVFVMNMREVKQEFDQLEKERLNWVKEAFQHLIDASEKLDTAHERQFILHDLRHKLETMDLNAEVQNSHEPYMETYPVPHFVEYTGQEEPNDVEIRGPRQTQEAPEDSTYEEEEVDHFGRTRVELPTLQIRPRPPQFDGRSDTLWWTDTPHQKKTVAPIAKTPLPKAHTDENRPVIIAFRNTAISPLRGLAIEESPASECYPGATAVMANVKVKAIRAYTGRNPSELSFGIGQTIKQKTPSDTQGMAYGWLKKRRTGKKRYGYFPVKCVEMKAKKAAITERIFRAVTRQF